MDLKTIETENVAEENGEREHVTFHITAKKIKEQVVQEGPPTFIAQTKKHSEKQILKEVRLCEVFWIKFVIVTFCWFSIE